MIHMTKKLDLTQRPLGINLVIKRIRYLLYRHVLVRVRIQRGASTRNKKIKIRTKGGKKEKEKRRINLRLGSTGEEKRFMKKRHDFFD